MDSRSLKGLILGGALMIFGASFTLGEELSAGEGKEPSFKSFDAKAKKGERLTVVFFGCSLTWGANASDQSLTSYRARVADALEAKYPDAHFKFYDAAIGGTNSILGAFRVDRDVLSRKPDLVFADFTLNDNAYSSDPEYNASYEAIIRRIILEAKCPVVQMFLCSEGFIAEKDLSKMLRRSAHYDLSKAYGTGIGDAILEIKRAVADGEATLAQLWPYKDKCHPGDLGYAYYAKAAMKGLNEAIEEGKACKAPEKMVWADSYMHILRFKLPDFAKELPQGWTATHPSLTAAWHDALMTRWIDGVAEASNMTDAPKGKEEPIEAAPLKLSFKGSSVLLFGEKNVNGGKIKVSIDGKPLEKPIDLSSKQIGGNVFLSALLATKLDPSVEHELLIEPLFTPGTREVVRLESVCVAGPAPEAGLVK